MTVFRYKALTDGGKRVSGTIEASTRREATQGLREQGMHVTAMEQTGGAVADRLRRIRGSRADETYVFHVTHEAAIAGEAAACGGS